MGLTLPCTVPGLRIAALRAYALMPLRWPASSARLERWSSLRERAHYGGKEARGFGVSARRRAGRAPMVLVGRAPAPGATARLGRPLRLAKRNRSELFTLRGAKRGHGLATWLKIRSATGHGGGWLSPG